VWSAFLVGLLGYVLEIGLIITPAVFGLTLAGLPGGYPDLAFAVGWSPALGWPLLLEMIAMTAALAFNPERLGTTRPQGPGQGRAVRAHPGLPVRSPGAPKGAGQRLMTSLTADWRRQNAIVIGYPATKGLIRFYVELGARRDYPRGPRQRETPHGHRHRAANGTATSSLTIRTSRGVHAGAFSASVRVKAGSRMARGGVSLHRIDGRYVTVETGFVTVD